jgi:hypothetical protein
VVSKFTKGVYAWRLWFEGNLIEDIEELFSWMLSPYFSTLRRCFARLVACCLCLLWLLNSACGPF